MVSGPAERVPVGAGLVAQLARARLFTNIAETIRDVPSFIVKRQIEHFTKAGPAYGEGVAQALQRAS
jgi:catalase